MKKYRSILSVLILLLPSIIVAQVKDHEVILNDEIGDSTYIKLSETKVESDLYSIKNLLIKQYNLENKSNFVQTKSFIENDFEVRKLQQYYNGFKVEFGEVVVSSSRNRIKTINGKVYKLKKFNTKYTLSNHQALDKALSKLNSSKLSWQDKHYEENLKMETKNNNATYKPTGELVIIDKDLFDSKFEPVLVYKFNIYSLEPLFRDEVYINANNGEIVFRNPIIKHIQGTASTRYSGVRYIDTQQYGNSYRLRDYSRGNGIETLNLNRSTNYGSASDFTDNDNNWSSAEYNNSNKDNAALDAHWGAKKTYDYFSQKHNRNSYDGNGALIRSYVHYGSNYDNAFWDGQRMTYGDGGSSFDALTSIDVVAHEIGHAFCEHSANLVYQNEPGAINEGLSDIWGAMVEFYAAPEKQTYLIGEEITLGGGYLRSMSSPNSNNQPDTYHGDYWYTGSGDRGGVHTNSGVLNYWFYLMSEGGSGTNDVGSSFNILGMGKDKASKIIYRAENIYFTSTTNYAQARELTIQAADDLYGGNSIESSIACQAWHAVGVGGGNCAVDYNINGSSTACFPNSYTYTVDNLQPGNSTTWSVSSNLKILNVYSNSVVVKPVNTSRSTGNIYLNVNGYVSKKTIWVGKPISPTSLSGPSRVNSGALVRYYSGIAKGASSYEWRLPYPFDTVTRFNYFGPRWQMRPTTGRSLNAFTGYAKISGSVQVWGKNICGNGGARSIRVSHRSRGGPGGGGIP